MPSALRTIVCFSPLIPSEQQGNVSDGMARTRSPQSLENKLKMRIAAADAGSVFSPSYFLDLGNRAAVDKALSRLAAAGTIRRLGRGLYDHPKTHPQLGKLSPSVDDIAKALAGRHKIRLQPAGAYAANLLRLSEQVPAKVVFLTDGPSRKVRVGNRTIELRRTSSRNMAAAGRTSGLVIAALRELGQSHVTRARIAHLRALLSKPDRARLLKDLSLAPVWMHPFLRFIAAEEEADDGGDDRAGSGGGSRGRRGRSAAGGGEVKKKGK